MRNDVFESVSQGIGGKEIEETRRIQEIADELSRRCGIYEAKLRKGETNGDGRIEQSPNLKQKVIL